MRKRGLFCRPVSVRLSVTLVHCINTAKDIVKLLTRPGSLNIIVILTPSAGTKDISGDAKYKGVGIFFL